MLPVVLAGTSYKNCPLEVRERLAPSPTDMVRWLDTLRSLTREAVVLSTCHRLEIYAIPHTPLTHPPRRLEAVAPKVRLGWCYYAQGEEAVRRLFRVSAGLDSAVTGETQILRQVRQAQELARGQGSSGPILSALFRHAVATGRRVRAGGLGNGYASLGAAAAGLAGRLLEPLHGKSALIIGAGKVGELAGQALREQGVTSITITSRTFPRAQELASCLGAQSIAFKDLSRTLASCHLLLTATTAPHWIVPRQTVAAAMTGREEPLLILDLAVPRDVEPSAATVPGVSLRNVDDLVQQLGLGAPNTTRGVAQAEAAVSAGMAQFKKWLLESQATPTISALYHQADEVCQAELRRARGRLGDVSAEEWDTLHHLARAISRKLLHPAVARLRAEAASGNGHQYTALVSDLFAIERNRHGKAHQEFQEVL